MKTVLLNRPQDSVLASLRRLVPHRHVNLYETQRIAELQASRLLALWGVDDGPVPNAVVADLPRVRIVYVDDLPISGTSHWSGTEWIIALHSREPSVRQRFTLMHEFKHILDHGQTSRLYHDTRWRSAADQAEQVADYFAGCVLLPRRLLKRAWGNRIQSPTQLAKHFATSVQAVEVRLMQVGLSVARPRCHAALDSRTGDQLRVLSPLRPLNGSSAWAMPRP